MGETIQVPEGLTPRAYSLWCRTQRDGGVDVVERRVSTTLTLRDAADEEGDSIGSFEGIASAFDVVDSYGTKWAPGAWTEGGLKDGDLFALLWMHDYYDVRGIFAATEKQDGLWIAGGWDNHPQGQAARISARTGSAAELSVGFWVRGADYPEDDPDGAWAIFRATELVETSQVTRNFAAQPGAGLTTIRTRSVPVTKLDGREHADTRRRARAMATRLRLS